LYAILKVHKKLGQTHLAQMNFSWAIDLDPKGANNQIKDAIDKRYLPDDDDSTLGLGCNESSMDQSADATDEEAMGLELDSGSSSSMVLF
jgi:anaphase-promoting complex subunit 3